MKPVPTDSLEYQTQKKNQKYNFRIALAQGILMRISFNHLYIQTYPK